MYNVCKTDQDRIHCLEQIFRINPRNEKAQYILEKLTSLSPDHPKPENSIDLSSETSLPAQESLPSHSPQDAKGDELPKPDSITSTPLPEPLHTQSGEMGQANEKTIIELLQKQNEILENLRLLIWHSTESQTSKDYRLSTRIVDINMSISSISDLMFKWFIASIPVGIVMGFIFLILSSCFRFNY